MRFLKYALYLLILFIFVYVITAKGTFGSLPKDGEISLEKRPLINSESAEQKQIFYGDLLFSREGKIHFLFPAHPLIQGARDTWDLGMWDLCKFDPLAL